MLGLILIYSFTYHCYSIIFKTQQTMRKRHTLPVDLLTSALSEKRDEQNDNGYAKAVGVKAEKATDCIWPVRAVL